MIRTRRLGRQFQPRVGGSLIFLLLIRFIQKLVFLPLLIFRFGSVFQYILAFRVLFSYGIYRTLLTSISFTYEY